MKTTSSAFNEVKGDMFRLAERLAHHNHRSLMCRNNKSGNFFIPRNDGKLGRLVLVGLRSQLFIERGRAKLKGINEVRRMFT